MKLRFLCAPHRQEMYRNHALAIYCWQDGFDNGLSLFELMRWREALPFLGQAFEAAEIILTTSAMEGDSACEIFTASSLALASTLANLGQMDECINICHLSQERLGQVSKSDPKLTFWLDKFNEQIIQHKLHPSLLNSFTGMEIHNRKIMPMVATVH